MYEPPFMGLLIKIHLLNSFFILQLSALKTGSEYRDLFVPSLRDDQLFSNFKSLEYLDVSRTKAGDDCMRVVATNCSRLQ